MDIKMLLTVFGTIFVAELGDKTQLATLLFATDRHAGKLTIFAGAAAALVLSAALAVAAGGIVSQYVSERLLSWVAGVAFVVIGIWTIVNA